MPNRNKVIYDIGRCTCNVPDACRDCSHYTGKVGFECMENLLTDALALLKKQQQMYWTLEHDWRMLKDQLATQSNTQKSALDVR